MVDGPESDKQIVPCEEVIELRGLSEKWEALSFVRRRVNETGELIRWPSPKCVGVASMKLSLV